MEAQRNFNQTFLWNLMFCFEIAQTTRPKPNVCGPRNNMVAKVVSRLLKILLSHNGGAHNWSFLEFDSAVFWFKVQQNEIIWTALYACKKQTALCSILEQLWDMEMHSSFTSPCTFAWLPLAIPDELHVLCPQCMNFTNFVWMLPLTMISSEATLTQTETVTFQYWYQKPTADLHSYKLISENV